MPRNLGKGVNIQICLYVMYFTYSCSGLQAISKALGEWYYGKAAVQRIDYENDLPRVCLTL